MLIGQAVLVHALSWWTCHWLCASTTFESLSIVNIVHSSSYKRQGLVSILLRAFFSAMWVPTCKPWRTGLKPTLSQFLVYNGIAYKMRSHAIHSKLPAWLQNELPKSHSPQPPLSQVPPFLHWCIFESMPKINGHKWRLDVKGGIRTGIDSLNHFTKQVISLWRL